MALESTIIMAKKKDQIAKAREIVDIFRKNMRRRRKELKLSQREVAETGSLNISFVGSIEKGEKTPSLTYIQKISEALDIHISWLFVSPEDDPQIALLKERLQNRFYSILKEMDEDGKILFFELLHGVDRYVDRLRKGL